MFNEGSKRLLLWPRRFRQEVSRFGIAFPTEEGEERSLSYSAEWASVFSWQDSSSQLVYSLGLYSDFTS